MRPQRSRYRAGVEPPRLGRCDNPASLETTARQHLRCGAALTEATVMRLAPDHPALSAQTAITDIIDSGIGDFGVYTDHPLPAANVPADVRALAQGILSGIDEDRAERIVPADLAAAYGDALAAESPEGATPPDPRREVQGKTAPGGDHCSRGHYRDVDSGAAGHRLGKIQLAVTGSKRQAQWCGQPGCVGRASERDRSVYDAT